METHNAPTQESSHTIPRIVVGVDGSDSAASALEWAVAEAGLRDAELEVVHAWHLPYLGGDIYATPAYDPAPFEEAARNTLDAAVDNAETGHLSRPVLRTLAMGGAPKAILAAAVGADLVVVGTRGLGGFKGLLLGSVSHQIAQHATCPVVLVPSAE